MGIGDALQNLRKKNGLSVKELSEKTGIGEATIFRIEGDLNYNTSINTIKSLIKCLNTNFEDFFRASGLFESEISKDNKNDYQKKENIAQLNNSQPTTAHATMSSSGRPENLAERIEKMEQQNKEGNEEILQAISQQTEYLKSITELLARQDARLESLEKKEELLIMLEAGEISVEEMKKRLNL